MRYLLCFVLLVVVVAGCHTQVSPQSQLFMVEASYNAAGEQLYQYIVKADLTLEELETLVVVHEAMVAARQAYREAVLTGKSSGEAFKEFQIKLDALLRAKAEMEAKR